VRSFDVIETVRLEKIKYGILMRLTEEFLRDAKIDVIEDTLAREIEVAVRVGIFGKQHEKVECKYPADWWQAFRERFFPKWWVKRWPVAYTKMVLDVKELFPKLAIPDGVHHVDWAIVKPFRSDCV
jgi:hypothetical protein